MANGGDKLTRRLAELAGSDRYVREDERRAEERRAAEAARDDAKPAPRPTA